MSAKLYDTESSVVLENRYAEICISKKDSKLEKIIFKPERDIKREDTSFFEIYDSKKNIIPIKALELNGNVITVKNDVCDFDMSAEAFDEYFIFEMLTKVSGDIHDIVFANMSYNYDAKDDPRIGASAISMNYLVNPQRGPEVNYRMTRANIRPYLADAGAKLALVISPYARQREILKEISLKVDKNEGICSSVGGAFALDSRIVFGNYNIQYESNQKAFRERLPFFKEMGIDIIDFHHGYDTFRQGDFKYVNYEDGADFKRQVTDVLAENGMMASLHTYTAYIDHYAEAILSRPENLRQLQVKKTFTLAEDLNDASEYVVVEESREGVETSDSFYQQKSPYLLIGDEIVKFTAEKDGFKIEKRGDCCTKTANHKKGDKAELLVHFYWCFFPQLNSELFLEVARNTAKAYNEGGYRMIYFDACEGIHNNCEDWDDHYYYVGKFFTEVLKNCKLDPIIESSAGASTVWAAGGRRGAFDTPSKGYKSFIDFHTRCNLPCLDAHSTATIGWYEFYPVNENQPADYHTKYQFTDDLDHMGSIAVKYDFSISYHGFNPLRYNKCTALRRNIAYYKRYDDLRKAEYFSKEYRAKLIASNHDTKLIEKRGGRFTFVEYEVEKKKFYDLSDSERNAAEFKNPFGKQTPFIRLEALLSTKGENPIVLMPLDIEKELDSQTVELTYPHAINLSSHLARKVTVRGNGKKGSGIMIKLRESVGHPMMLYVLDTSFTGERTFILAESDNGERTDLKFSGDMHYWSVYGAGMDQSKVARITVQTNDEAEGVRVSSITAVEECYDVVKNPTVEVGESEITFECELKSTDYIEYDGSTAKVYDRNGDAKEVNVQGNLVIPRGKFKASVTGRSLNRLTSRAYLTFGYTGKEIK